MLMRTSAKRKKPTSETYSSEEPFFKNTRRGIFSSSSQNSNLFFKSPTIQSKSDQGPQKSQKVSLQNKDAGKTIETQLQDSKGGGVSLGRSTKRVMERNFGSDFSNVKIHTGHDAEQMNYKLDARAFTNGNDIYFNKGQYNPNTQEGNKLLAHELTHVLQQSNNTGVIQRNIFDDIYNWVKKIYNTGTLWAEIHKQLTSSTININKIVRTIKRATYPVRQTLYRFDTARKEIMSALSGEDLVKVMSALLSGDTYRPGWESEGYHLMSTTDQATLNKDIDRQFEKETGITRSLNPSSSIDMPLVRKWLRIRDRLYTSMIDKKIEEESYEDYLREAIAKMKGVTFNSKLNFEPKDDEKEIDIPGLSYWKLVSDPDMSVQLHDEKVGMLYFKGTPEEAWKGVDELFEAGNLKSWAYDCAEFVQAAHMYARRHTFGEDGFSETIKKKGGKLYLRMHYSTGFNAVKMYQRKAMGGAIFEQIPGKAPKKTSLSMGKILDDAPIGSRVVWRNIKAKGTYFYNENAIKLGNDEFAAHGFTHKQRFTRSELEAALAAITNTSADEKYIKDNVFIRTVEYVSVH